MDCRHSFSPAGFRSLNWSNGDLAFGGSGLLTAELGFKLDVLGVEEEEEDSAFLGLIRDGEICKVAA